MRSLIVALLLLVPVSVSAQEEPSDRLFRASMAARFAPAPQLRADKVPSKTERILLKACMALNLGGNAYDATTTIRAIRSGRFVEGNPALQWIGDKPERIIPIKAAYVVGSTWGFVKLAENHPRLAAAAACTSGAVSAWAGSTNRRALGK
jgi:hypothetical protein